ncbi:hypothetical protein V6N12_074782 [Hibiscus sabdariffa]|uniref:Putative plant transposon protein domain-containing protein n=1 Tax=Hibiscus sabdariffa TaxID=183260 RepID=A0ABR2D2F0_9ROSI
MAQTSAYMARTDRFIQKIDAFMDRTEMKLQNHDATLKSLETQVGQISQILSSRPIGRFPSDTEVSKDATHEQCKAITTRSGKILKSNQRETVANPSPAMDTPAEADNTAQASEDHSNPHTTMGESSAESSHAQSDKPEEIRPPPPFPQRLKKQKQDYQFKKFLDILKQVHINLPLVEALQQMPNYAKFLKDMVTRKKRIEEFETAAATETCLALMHNKVPAKKTDPGSFTIECFIGHNYPTKALCDPGASINLMPKSVFQKLGIGEAKPTTVMLQLADHSYVHLEGKIEDILVQVDKFIFPADFLILDCEADEYAPIILRRPILSTSRAVIDFDNDEIIFKIEPARANYNWVIEFYANNAAGEDFSTVRGRRVPATAATINAILGLPNDEPSFYAMLGGFGEEDYEVIKDFLRLPNTEWNTTARNPNSVSRPNLLPEAKLWNTFVKRNLMPTSHNQTVDRTRLLLINIILTGYRVNIGEILAQELAAACANDKGILAFPCLVSTLCRKVAVPTYDGDKYQSEKTGWTRVVYMRKMDLADAIPINVAMPTPPASPTPVAATPADDAGPSAPAEQQRTPPPSPPVIPVSSQTTTHSPATTPAAPTERSRDKTLEMALWSTPSFSPPPPAVAQSEEAAPPLHIMLLRSQLQRIEARQFTFQEEMKSPRDLLQPLGPITSTPAPAVPILSAAPTPTTSVVAEHPTPDSPTRRKGKAKAGRTFGREILFSPEEEAEQRQPKRRRKYHVITAESDEDDSTAEILVARPEQLADPSFSPSI